MSDIALHLEGIPYTFNNFLPLLRCLGIQQIIDLLKFLNNNIIILLLKTFKGNLLAVSGMCNAFDL
jgi:hypothetical protein